LGEGWALIEETKKASHFDDKKKSTSKTKFNIGHSSRRKVDADAVPWAEISWIVRFRSQRSDGPALATAFFLDLAANDFRALEK